MLTTLLIILFIFMMIAYAFFAGFMGSWPLIIRKISKQKYTDCESYYKDRGELFKWGTIIAQSKTLWIVVNLNKTSDDKKYLKDFYARDSNYNVSKLKPDWVLIKHWESKTLKKLDCRNRV